jgi:two-component system, cell cycle sensor histidine kinase and response regulator CckA
MAGGKLPRAGIRSSKLIEALPVATVEIGREGRIGLANAAAERLFGYDRQELAGQPAALLFPERLEAAYAALETEYLADPERKPSGLVRETIGRRKDGTEIPVEIRLGAAGGSRGGLIALVRQIGVAEPSPGRDPQTHKLDALGRLAGAVAHDLNNLLTIMSGYSQLAFEALDPASPLRSDMAAVIEAAKRASELTNRLLTFSRRQPARPALIDLNRQIRTIAPVLKPILGDGIRLETKLAPALGCIQADPSQFEQVLINLALNAREAMPSGGQLVITTRRVSPGGIVLSVEDTGTGMDSATLERVFEPFFTTKPKGKGVGFGLATVYGIVRQNGGDISVESEPGRGSKFVIRLPRANE